MDLINARENFKSLPNNTTALRVFAGGSFFSGISFDKVLITYPSTSVEQYEAYLSGVLQKTIQITYTNSSKMYLTKVETTYAL